MDYYIGAFKKYAVFSGRATRKEFWMFTLINTIVNIIVAVALTIIVGEYKGLIFIPTLYTLAVFIPSLAISCRRLHDIGKSGWWILITLVPFIGSLLLFSFYVIDSQTGTNKYGPNPKGDGYVQKNPNVWATIIAIVVILFLLVMVTSIVLVSLNSARKVQNRNNSAPTVQELR